MRLDTLAVLRCPYCGGRLVVREDVPRVSANGELLSAVLACLCAQFSIVDGIAVMTLGELAQAAREQLEAGRPEEALDTLLKGDTPHVLPLLRSPSTSYQAIVEALGDGPRGGYFFYRFSDPTFVVADAVARSVGGVVLDAQARILDLCGGSGHLTGMLEDLTPTPPLVLDASFVTLWLARRFCLTSADAICADAASPLPIATGTFRLAICNDAVHYIWPKALLAREMIRVVDSKGAAVLAHAHNADQWNPSAGDPLPPHGYRDLFEKSDTRVFAESRLLREAVEGRLDLRDSDVSDTLSEDPSLTIVASRDPRVFVRHQISRRARVRGRLTVNPLYASTVAEHDTVCLRLTFPSDEYEDEYAICRSYLPATVTVERQTLVEAEEGRLSPRVRELMAQRVLLDLPPGYL